MKTEINIVQGEVKIILHAENSFEKELVEKIKDGEYESCNLKSSVHTDYSYGNHRLDFVNSNCCHICPFLTQIY